MSASQLRPRTRRLISGLDEGDEVAFDPTTAPNIRIASPVPSSLDQRSASPIPPGHLPRPTSNYDRRVKGAQGSHVPPNSSTTSLERLWGTSWTAIQGIASDLLGSSTHEGPPLAKGKVPRKRTQPGSSAHRSTLSAPPDVWGPTTPGEAPTINDVGVGTREETEAAFRARKKIDLLESHESSFVDSFGRYKRRNSDQTVERDDQHSRDALVYLHHVQKGDTFAGITLKYNCSAAVIRRTNRMWPNDLIQSRTSILLPVDACGVKGTPVSGPEEVDLLGDENAPIPAGLAESGPSTPVARNRSNSNVTNDTSTTNTTTSAARSTIDSEAWHHESWVLLPGTTKPTEIVRLSRQNLGYFPPARRKSLTLSDMDSPRSSFDRSRSVVADALTRTSVSPLRQNKHDDRRLSSATNGYFSYLTGPGGVGTMDKTVRAPGPAPDSLNIYFAKHLPDVAPPRNQHALYQPELPLFTDDDVTPTMSGTTTPIRGRNLENMGGAIETWMRRVASKAREAAATTSNPAAERNRAARASVGAPGKGAGGIGDLIEMTDEFEIGNDDEDTEDTEARTARAPSAPGGTSFRANTTTARQRTKSGKSD